ncbi:MAG: peptidylprolyl isomerase [Chloroflexi bacterium]|nr:peptidylprolyl isomerase [Chloroflexota bacterium]
MATVQDNMVVSLDYTLRLDDEGVVDTSEGREPLMYIQGQGQIIPGLEKQLAGMETGQEKDVVVLPEEGYGEYDSDLVETLPRSIFPPELEEGMAFRMRTDDGRIAVVYVEEIQGDQVVVNLNHPLAGKTLYFHVRVNDVREATPEELMMTCDGCGGSCSSCGDSCCDDDSCCDEEGCCH